MEDTFLKLDQIDPDDIGDAISDLIRSLNLKIGKDDFRDVITYGDLCERILEKVEGEEAGNCTTQQAFYKLRRAFQSSYSGAITANTPLILLLPSGRRRMGVKKAEHQLGFKLKILSPPIYLIVLLLAAFIGSLVYVFFDWKTGLTALALSLIGFRISAILGNELDHETFGELVRDVTRRHYFLMRSDPTTVNRAEILQLIEDTFTQDLGIHKSELTKDRKLFQLD
jgi:hypothetical protein